MKGIWYSSNAKGCEHWYRHNGANWEVISRCGKAYALPSLLKDKFNWNEEHPKLPRMEGSYCKSCLSLKEKT